MLKEKQAAPDFLLKDQNQQDISLKSFKGKKTVIYFYPKDNTPGCTKEACAIRDVYDSILAKGAVVLGISGDDVASHVKFRERFNLPFYLLADPGFKVAESYGAFGENKLYGKTFLGIKRSTFIVDEQGLIIKVFPKVKPEGHGEEILKYL